MSKRLDYVQIAPAGVKALGGVYGYVMQSDLSPVLVDLVYLRVSQINNCAYCLDMHTRDLLKKGVKVEKLALGTGLEPAHGGDGDLHRSPEAQASGASRTGCGAFISAGRPLSPASADHIFSRL